MICLFCGSNILISILFLLELKKRKKKYMHYWLGYRPKCVQGEAEENGATFCYNSTAMGGRLEENRMCLEIFETKCLENLNSGFPSQPDMVLIPKLVVNSAGLSAPVLAKRFEGLHSSFIPPSYYARGCYFTLSSSGAPPFKQLIYPIPEEGGLGVHVTLDLDGQVKFGPDVEWIDGVDDISSFLDRYSSFLCPSKSSITFFPFNWFMLSVKCSFRENLEEENFTLEYSFLTLLCGSVTIRLTIKSEKFVYSCFEINRFLHEVFMLVHFSCMFKKYNWMNVTDLVNWSSDGCPMIFLLIGCNLKVPLFCMDWQQLWLMIICTIL